MKAIAGGKPVAVIDMQAYGTMNGAKVSGTGVKASWDVKSLTMALSLSVTGGSFYRAVENNSFLGGERKTGKIRRRGWRNILCRLRRKSVLRNIW